MIQGTAIWLGPVLPGGRWLPNAGFERARPPSRPFTPSPEPLGFLMPTTLGLGVMGNFSTFASPNDPYTRGDRAAITRAELDTIRAAPPRLRLVPDDAIRDDRSYYGVAMRWMYERTPRALLQQSKVVIADGSEARRLVVAHPLDWGPRARAGRVVDVTPPVSIWLASEDRQVFVSWAPPDAVPGPYIRVGDSLFYRTPVDLNREGE